MYAAANGQLRDLDRMSFSYCLYFFFLYDFLGGAEKVKRRGGKSLRSRTDGRSMVALF